ncbi:MAG TPA: prephenate dehydratase domain-containing protein [Sphingomicrobium sp.]|nr:prephenate dehydratase domain-containing protein [Sphingomicrobium sp.]
MRAVYPGAPGAFAHAACRAMLPEHDAQALPSFEAVAAALGSDPDLRGVLPVRNNIAGEVPGVQALISFRRLRALRSFDLQVRLHLLGLPSCNGIDRLKMVVSHPIALAQCAKALSALDVALIEAPSTALAAQSLSDSQTAVLASGEAADLYGLKILDRDLQVRVSITTFLLLRG